MADGPPRASVGAVRSRSRRHDLPSCLSLLRPSGHVEPIHDVVALEMAAGSPMAPVKSDDMKEEPVRSAPVRVVPRKAEL